MDVERQIDKLEIEAIVNNNFDDARISFLGESVYCQMKDIDSIKFEDLTLEENRINYPIKLMCFFSKTLIAKAITTHF